MVLFDGSLPASKLAAKVVKGTEKIKKTGRSFFVRIAKDCPNFGFLQLSSERKLINLRHAIPIEHLL